MQFWRLIKDCKMHGEDYGLTDMNRWLARTSDRFKEFHNPHRQILFREFLDHLVILAFHLYQGQHEEGSGPILARCLSKLISDNILKHACSVKGYLYRETRRTVNALVHLEDTLAVYNGLLTPRKRQPADSSLTMRQFLLALKDMNLIDKNLTAKLVIDILSSDDPKVSDDHGSVNLELEMCFLEFFEALIGCAQYYVTEAVIVNPELTHRNTDVDALEHSAQLSVIPGVGSGLDNALEAKHAKLSGSALKVTVSNTSQSTADHLPVSPNQMLSGSFIKVDGDDASENVMSSEMLQQQQQQPQPSDLLSVPHEIDEATRQFNFWTHQIHIFFIRKFFPAAQLLFTVRERARADAELEQLKDARRLAGC
jgi:hypothetical protein